GSVFWFRLPVQTAQEPSAEIADDNPDPNVEIEKKSILIVEDNLINREVLRDMLQLDGHDVTITVDGQAGVDAAQSRRFDLIFMDISMPGLDGVQATQILRSSEGPCRDTPIIALTAHAMPDEIIRFREAGMNHCATKPIELSELRKLVSGGFRKAAFKSSPNERSENSEDALFALLDTLGEEKFKAVTAEFLEQGEHVLDFLAGAMTDDSIAEMQTLVHQMLGSLSFLGLNGLIAVLSELDFASKNNEITRIMGFGREFSEGWQDARKWLVEKAALKGVDLG
ncbi:MAG: response regulator, partial [Paracoccaceae bacterium]|nr:response regulator [Paracoccaceae bacterium]